ncbi:hypothetical protein K2X89_15935, partial [Myxococcota bacterium]|nr:hypothetical protein [Myxococcota bacterium]
KDKTHRFIIDPIDGTTNFMHGIPQFAISIGLEREGHLVSALVFNPVTFELYAGTDSGVFRYSFGGTWTPLGDGLLEGCTPLPGKVSCAPTHNVYGPNSMAIVGTGPSTVLRVATFSRGIWEYWLGGVDSTPPIVQPLVSGPVGNDGWYVGDVSVGFGRLDPESPRIFESFCDSGTVTADTVLPGKTYSCRVSSFGGKTSQTVTIKRDATPPVLSCGPYSVFEQYGVYSLPASVDGGVSGTPTPTVSVRPDTSRIGMDLIAHFTAEDGAGNVGSVDCAYQVVPEPGLISGLAFGLALLGAQARSRKRRSEEDGRRSQRLRLGA